MNPTQVIAHLKSGGTVKAEVLSNGGFRFTMMASEEVERFTYLQVEPTVTTWPVHAVPVKPSDRRDPTAWLRDRFGGIRR